MWEGAQCQRGFATATSSWMAQKIKIKANSMQKICQIANSFIGAIKTKSMELSSISLTRLLDFFMLCVAKTFTWR
jgi:hypothetical protein